MGLISAVKRILVGKPIHTKHAHHERLPKRFALPVFASDALSSTAYATEEILLVLMLAGPLALPIVFNVSLWLSALMIIIGFSYYQTIHAYPKGGGTYLVSTENLGSGVGRIAGASLLIDYVLTVAVSISSGIAAIVSLNPAAKQFAIPIGVLAVLVLMIANLRGAKESGILFAIPTYTFVSVVMILVVKGIIDSAGAATPTANLSPPPEGWHAMNAFLLLRAFAASCTALTGTEAIADGVQAFKPPEAKNAAYTLMIMIVLLMTMFIGLSYLAMHEATVPMRTGDAGYKTVLAQLGLAHFGGGFMFNLLQIATAAVLFLAANTAYADFPRLSSFIARDGFLPRQLASIGDRLVFQNGIILLSISAAALIVIYKADTHSLIPLYAMGVFISFTLSQAGMAVKFKREKAKAWKTAVSGFGALVTFIVLVILLVTKFHEGAWLIVIALAVMLMIFGRIKRHYNYLAKELEVDASDRLPEVQGTVLLLVPRLHKGILQAIAYARAMAKDVRALHVTIDPNNVGQVKTDWNRFGADMPLVILESPYRSLIEPIIDYVDQALAENPTMMVTVIVPQAVPKYWWQGILHNNAAVALKLALAGRKNVVITNVRYFLS